MQSHEQMQNKIFDVIYTKTNFNPLKIDFIIFAPAHEYKKRPLSRLRGQKFSVMELS